MRIALWRILANDLPPRHPQNQTEDNLKFILENERSFLRCDKFFLLNRIVHADKREKLIRLLDKHHYRYYEIPFIADEFRRLRTDQEMVQYFTNLNPARNFCIEKSFRMAYQYAMPFDSGSYLRPDGWLPIQEEIEKSAPYVVVPQARALSDEICFSRELPDLYEEYTVGRDKIRALRELTVVFSDRSDVFFNENLQYGDVDKVELLWRLGLNNEAWKEWNTKALRESQSHLSKHIGNIPTAGFVIRLPSQNAEADSCNLARGQQRAQGIQNLLSSLKMRFL